MPDIIRFLNCPNWVLYLVPTLFNFYFLSLLITYGIGGGQTVSNLVSMSNAAAVTIYTYFLSTIVMMFSQQISKIVSLLTFVKVTFLSITVLLVSSIGNHRLLKYNQTNFEYIKEPTLVASVAIGGIQCLLPTIFAHFYENSRHISVIEYKSLIRRGITYGILASSVLCAIWSFAVTTIVPQNFDTVCERKLSKVLDFEETTAPMLTSTLQVMPETSTVATAAEIATTAAATTTREFVATDINFLATLAQPYPTIPAAEEGIVFRAKRESSDNKIASFETSIENELHTTDRSTVLPEILKSVNTYLFNTTDTSIFPKLSSDELRLNREYQVFHIQRKMLEAACQHNISISSSKNSGQISTAPIETMFDKMDFHDTSISSKNYRKLTFIMTLVNFFTATSTTVNFLALGTGLLDTIFSFLGLADHQVKLSYEDSGYFGSQRNSGKSSRSSGSHHQANRFQYNFATSSSPDGTISHITILQNKAKRYMIGYAVFTVVFIFAVLNVSNFEKILEKYTAFLVNFVSGPVIYLLYVRCFGFGMFYSLRAGLYYEFLTDLLRLFGFLFFTCLIFMSF